MTEIHCHNEILTNIPDEDLEILADMYRESDIPYACSVLTNGRKIRKKRSFLIRFMSPHNCWKEDGTFFALMEFPAAYDLAVFTLDKEGKSVYEGLKNTKRLHYSRPLVFFGIHERIYPTILKVIKDKGLKVRSDNLYNIYSMPKTEAMNFDTECSEEIVIKQLEVSHAAFINEHWPLKFQSSDEYLASILEMNGGYGVFLKTNNALVAWTLKTPLGQVGILHTVEDHRRKGYAALVIKMLSKVIAEDDEDPSATISVENDTSGRLFEKLGFKNLGKCHYINLEETI